MTDLSGKKVAFVATDGYEDSELTSPWEAVTAAGATAVLIAPEDGSIEGKNGHTQPVDLTTDAADAADYDALVLPGGVVNADHLQMDEKAVAFSKAFFEASKPVAAICHAAWTLIEAGVVKGRTLTSYPSLKTDLRNAGAEALPQPSSSDWVDQNACVCVCWVLTGVDVPRPRS